MSNEFLAKSTLKRRAVPGIEDDQVGEWGAGKVDDQFAGVANPRDDETGVERLLKAFMRDSIRDG